MSAASGVVGDGPAATWSMRDVWSNVTRAVTVGAGEVGLLNEMVRPHEIKLMRPGPNLPKWFFF